MGFPEDVCEEAALLIVEAVEVLLGHLALVAEWVEGEGRAGGEVDVVAHGPVVRLALLHHPSALGNYSL